MRVFVAGRRVRSIAVASLVLAATIGRAESGAAAEPPSGTLVRVAETSGRLASKGRDAAIEDRTVYGLPTDEATMDLLFGGGDDVGTSRWGILLTSKEAQALDLDTRQVWEGQILDTVFPMSARCPRSPAFESIRPTGDG